MQAEYIQGLRLHTSTSQEWACSTAGFRHKEAFLDLEFWDVLLSSGILLNEWRIIMILWVEIFKSGFKEKKTRGSEKLVYIANMKLVYIAEMGWNSDSWVQGQGSFLGLRVLAPETGPTMEVGNITPFCFVVPHPRERMKVREDFLKLIFKDSIKQVGV